MYDVIVIGATFAAAGIAHALQKNCLILEQRAQAGYEFFGALNFGTNYEKKPETTQGQALQASFFSGNETLYGCDAHIYPYLKEANVLFGAQIVSVEKTTDGFSCLIHCQDGFRTYEANQVIDTRSCSHNILSKTFNLLVESNQAPTFPGVTAENTGMENHYILRCPVAQDCSFPQARTQVMEIIRQFSPMQRLILLPSEFDCRLEQTIPTNRDGILYLPSKVYDNPVLAFEAGLRIQEV